MDFKPGDTVILVRLRRVSETREVTITRVGRKYAYIELYGTESAFHVDSGGEKSDYTPEHRIFTPEGYDEYLAAQEADERLKALIRSYSWATHLTVDQKHRIADIIEEKH